ncbi:MAG: hypothetical protein ACI9GM_001048 [Salibacteraceae bacterium]|jgi:hypothetical protein
MNLKSIDQSRLKFSYLKKLITYQIDSGLNEFSDLTSTVPSVKELEGYGFVEDTFTFNHSFNTVFDQYVLSNPNETWNSGGLISFGLALDKKTEIIYYPGDSYPGASEGQILYLHSSILGLKKICMAQEVVTVSKEKQLIEFSYVKDGMTEGVQQISFTSIGDNKTVVSHVSRFKGVSSFRDIFYPFFHSLIISKFHQNLKKSLNP